MSMQLLLCQVLEPARQEDFQTELLRSLILVDFNRIIIFQQWDNSCFERNTDPFSAPLEEILEFLCEQFDIGKQYRTVNIIRYPISMIHEEVDVTRVIN